MFVHYSTIKRVTKQLLAEKHPAARLLNTVVIKVAINFVVEMCSVAMTV